MWTSSSINESVTFTCDNRHMVGSRTKTLLDMIIDRFRDNGQFHGKDQVCFRRLEGSRNSLLGQYDTFKVILELNLETENINGQMGDLYINPSLRGIPSRDSLEIRIRGVDSTLHGSNYEYTPVINTGRANESSSQSRSTTAKNLSDNKSMESLNDFLLDVLGELENALFTSVEIFQKNRLDGPSSYHSRG